MVGGTRAAHINEQLRNCVDGNSTHASDGAEGVSLYQRRNNLGPLVCAQAIHDKITLYLLEEFVNTCTRKYLTILSRASIFYS